MVESYIDRAPARIGGRYEAKALDRPRGRLTVGDLDPAAHVKATAEGRRSRRDECAASAPDVCTGRRAGIATRASLVATSSHTQPIVVRQRATPRGRAAIRG